MRGGPEWSGEISAQPGESNLVGWDWGIRSAELRTSYPNATFSTEILNSRSCSLCELASQ